jgi:nitrogen fixation NifU-like protein
MLQDPKTNFPTSAFEKFHPETPADGRGKRSSDCGDTIEFFLNLKNDKVTDVRFQIKGCNNTLTAARAAATLVHGKHIKEAMRLSSFKEIDAEANLPEPNKHCANLASEAMKEALRSAVTSSLEPWKKLYRKP